MREFESLDLVKLKTENWFSEMIKIEVQIDTFGVLIEKDMKIQPENIHKNWIYQSFEIAKNSGS